VSFRPGDKANGWDVLKRHPVALLADSELTSALESAAERKRTRLNVCLRGSSYAQLVEAVRSAGCAAILPAFVSHAQAGADVEFLPLNALKEYNRMIALTWNPHFCALRPAILSVCHAVAAALQKVLES
jgi:DNA-binding transcriptional LysR family regulator